MTQVMVAYGAATSDPQTNRPWQQRRQAELWAAEHDAAVLVWCREGRTALTKRIEERTRLHHALFCVRADFADDLWLTDWPHGWDGWDEALIHTVLARRGGRLVVNGDHLVPDPSDPAFARAQAWMGLLERLDPRTEEPTEWERPDLGAYTGVEEAARLVRKLRDDLGLNEAEIATWLRDYEYTSSRGDSFSAGGVHDLLTRYRPADIDVEQTQMTAEPGTPRPGSKFLAATFGPAAEDLIEGAIAWNAARPDPAKLVFPIAPDHATDRPAMQQRGLVMLLTAAPLLTSVHLAAEADLAADREDRMFILALLGERGVLVLVDGVPVQGLENRDRASREAYLEGRSTVRLHAILRAHDRGTVTDPSLSQTAAYTLVRDLRDQAIRRSWQQAAHLLNEEGIPTSSGQGQWWPSSAREMFQRGER